MANSKSQILSNSLSISIDICHTKIRVEHVLSPNRRAVIKQKNANKLNIFYFEIRPFLLESCQNILE